MPDDFDVENFIDSSLGLEEEKTEITQADVDNASQQADQQFQQQQNNQQQSQQQEPQQSQFDKNVDDIIKETMGESKVAQKQQDNKNQQQQQNQQQQPPDRGLRPVAGMPNQFIDKEGNIVDINGAIIAAKGMQRRLHQENSRLHADLNQTRDENSRIMQRVGEMQATVDSMREAGEIFRNANVTPDEMRDAANIIATFKANPVAAAREVVARAMALGHNITEIVGDEVGNSIDMQAVTQLINQRIGTTGNQPAQGGNQQQPPQNQAANHEYTAFMTRYPDAKNHENDIVYLMQKHQGINVYQAYDMLRSFAEANNLDIRRPLQPQVEAIQRAHAQQNPNPQQQQQQQQPSPKPMVQGQGNQASQQQVQQQMPTNTPAGADDSWSAILTDAFAELKQSGTSF